MIDLDPIALQAKGLSPRDVNNAINAQNLVLPTGDSRIGTKDYRVNMNNTPLLPEDYNSIPVKMVNGVVVYVRDIGFAHDGFIPQTNIVRNNGKRAVLLTVLKTGSASSVRIVEDIKKMLPTLRAAAPKGMNIDLLFDQTVFVKSAIRSVAIEGAMAALLTGAVILLFLGKLEEHIHRIYLHTSFDLNIDHPLISIRHEFKCDDPWRTCPIDWNIGGRSLSYDREHPSEFAYRE